MKTIAILNQKGGAGKTTLTVHIAAASDVAGKSTVILDMDTQGTAEAWASWRKENAGTTEPAVIGAKHSTLEKWLKWASDNKAAVAIIDTPPTAQMEAIEAAKRADILLIPCRPSGFDIHAMQLTANLARSSGKPAYVVFNAVPVRAASILAEAEGAIKVIGLQLAPVYLTERSAFRMATTQGRVAAEIDPKGKAAAEVAGLWQWLAKTLKVK